MTTEEPTVKPVADDEEAPPLQPLGADATAAAAETMAQRGTSKQGKRYAKAMAKMGLKPEPGILRINIHRDKAVAFSITKPEVYRFPNTNTFVIFGEAQLEEFGNNSQKSAARTVTGQTVETPAAAKPTEEAAGEEVDAGTLQENEIGIVMSQGNVTRGQAIKALKNNKGDIVNAIMELTV